MKDTKEIETMLSQHLKNKFGVTYPELGNFKNVEQATEIHHHLEKIMQFLFIGMFYITRDSQHTHDTVTRNLDVSLIVAKYKG